MRTQEEAEAWALEHSAVLKVNFVDGAASLQVGGFAVQRNGGGPLSRVLPELVGDLERQMSDRTTQTDPASEDVTRPR